MKTVNVQEAKTHLSRLLEEVISGQEIILAKAGKPVARLVPYKQPVKSRVGGQFAKQIQELEGCWESEEELFNDSIDRPFLYPRSRPNVTILAEDHSGDRS